MCILFWTTADPDYEIIVADNRDEFLARPTAPAAWRTVRTADGHDIDMLCGLDTLAGGTWMGVAKTGAFAVLTNVTELPPPRTTPDGQPLRSRGELVMSWLENVRDPAMYDEGLQSLEASKPMYAGFNLVVGHLSQEPVCVHYVSNRSRQSGSTLKGDGQSVQGVSNSAIDESWPKVVQGKQSMQCALQAPRTTEEELIDRLFGVLATSEGPLASHHEMRRTIHVEPLRIPSNKEKTKLATASEMKAGVAQSWYATRTSTLFMVTRTTPRRAVWIERDMYELDNDMPKVLHYTNTETRAQHERRFTWTLG